MSVVQETAWDVGVVYRVLFKMDIFHNQDVMTLYINQWCITYVAYVWLASIHLYSDISENIYMGPKEGGLFFSYRFAHTRNWCRLHTVNWEVSPYALLHHDGWII